MINSFVNRLESIGITVKLSGNYPWIYLTSVNDITVTEKLFANHGWAAFITPVNGDLMYMPNRRATFKLIREYINK